ncbi:hypothetical protein CLOSCI_01902 [[Clostridium] scindens ATCC 35704]|nr:hypothetical protein CLOSCI_01902 [[Clostridium] scindens ATCC 35704]BDF17550.1 hypothetical protein CE91St59_28130 [[Clostridium] scindens]BDF21247.1 hypothetical protein CE91St60_28300 [[Clostridium] scindens]
MADWPRKIDHLPEHKFNIGFKILPKSGEQRSIGDLGKAAKMAKLLTEGQKKNKQRICRDRKNLLKDESRKKAG